MIGDDKAGKGVNATHVMQEETEIKGTRERRHAHVTEDRVSHSLGSTRHIMNLSLTRH